MLALLYIQEKKWQTTKIKIRFLTVFNCTLGIFSIIYFIARICYQFLFFRHDSNVLVIFLWTSLFNDISWTHPNNIASSKNIQDDPNWAIFYCEFRQTTLDESCKGIFLCVLTIYYLSKIISRFYNYRDGG